MEYYSAIKWNEIESFVESWMDLETVKQSEVRKRKMDKELVVLIYNGISLSHEINVIRLLAA